MHSSQPFADLAAYPPLLPLAEKAQCVQLSLETLPEFWHVRREVRRNHAAAAPSSSAAGSACGVETRRKVLDAATEAVIRNMAYEAHTRAVAKVGHTSRAARHSASDLLPEIDEPLDAVCAPRLAWEASINEELIAIARERGQPLMCRAADAGSLAHTGLAKAAGAARPLDGTAAAPASRRGRSHSADGSDHSACGGQFRFLYDAEDLMDVVEHLDSGNAKQRCRSPWALVGLALCTPRLEVLRGRFSELGPHFRQSGLDDLLDGAAGGTRPGMPQASSGAPRAAALAGHHEALSFAADRQSAGRSAIASRFPPRARRFARRGVPNNLRPQLWRTALGLHAHGEEAEMDLYNELRSRAQGDFCVTDELHQMDAECCAHDDHYFVFGELLSKVLLCFSRDDAVRGMEKVHAHGELLGQPVPRPRPSAVPSSTTALAAKGAQAISRNDWDAVEDPKTPAEDFTGRAALLPAREEVRECFALPVRVAGAGQT